MNDEPAKWSSEWMIRGADHLVLRARPFIAVLLIAVLVADLVGVMTDRNFPAISGIELALAVGTLALAYAAAMTVASSVEARHEEDKWRQQRRKDRSQDRAALLDLRLERVSLTNSNPFLRGPAVEQRPILTSPFFVRVPETDRFSLVLRNLGPGSAVGVDVTVWGWLPGKDRKVGTQPGEPLPPPCESWDETARNASLRPNEDAVFEFHFAPPDVHALADSEIPYWIRPQFIVTATGRTVDGDPAEATPIGYFLWQLIEETKDPKDRIFQTVWKRLSNEQARALRVPPPGFPSNH